MIGIRRSEITYYDIIVQSSPSSMRSKFENTRLAECSLMFRKTIVFECHSLFFILFCRKSIETKEPKMLFLTSYKSRQLGEAFL